MRLKIVTAAHPYGYGVNSLLQIIVKIINMINIEINNIQAIAPPEIRVWRGTEDIAGNTPSPERFALVWKEEFSWVSSTRPKRLGTWPAMNQYRVVVEGVGRGLPRRKYLPKRVKHFRCLLGDLRPTRTSRRGIRSSCSRTTRWPRIGIVRPCNESIVHQKDLG